MTPSWRTLEREITDILEGWHFTVTHYEGETSLHMSAIDLPMTFSLTTFAKDLAKRLEQTR